jgi:hypothetical protein
VEGEAVAGVARGQTVGHVGLEPRPAVRAELRFLGGERQIHGQRRYPLTSPNPFP